MDVLEDSGEVLILMTRLPGEPFVDGFQRGSMSADEVAHFEDTLRDWFSQLRALPPPNPRGVCGFGGGPCKSDRVHHDRMFGPFPSVSELHDYLFTTVLLEHQDRLHTFAQKSHSKAHRICFTHGDIHPNNLLVSGNRLTGLVDWECAGWYPEYWDFTKAVYRRQRFVEWLESFQRVFPQYHDELDVEMAFWAVDCPF